MKKPKPKAEPQRPYHRCTPDQLAFIQNIGASLNDEDIRELVERRFGVCLSINQIRYLRGKSNVVKNANGVKKIQTPSDDDNAEQVHDICKTFLSSILNPFEV